ncbi:MAG: hypothetical protein ACXAB5_02405 [Candidatus Thorarchaeota archaeon]|jgi:hypothetical protein
MKRKISLIVLVALLMLSISSAPQVFGYSSAIRSHQTINWEIDAVPSVPFSMYYTEGGNWLADNESFMSFNIDSFDDDVVGTLSLGNVSVLANDTEVAKDLTLGVWGTHTEWWPGLIIKVDSPEVVSLNATAYASAERIEGNYLNGTMTSSYETITIGEYDHQCIVFDFEQDFPGNQVTHLAYSLTTGILIEANTSYSFGTLYELAIRFVNFVEPVDLTADPGGFITFTGIVGGGLLAVIVIVYIILSRKR